MQNDEAAIRAVVDEWLDATRRGDLDTVLGLMSDDVIFMVPGREPFGKEEFAGSNKSMGNFEIDGKSDIKEIKVVGDWAYIRNHLEIMMTAPNEKPRTMSGYTLTIFRKNPDGKWVLTRDANMVA
jgi:uncharacterized protein (TIGR02246 family)